LNNAIPITQALCVFLMRKGFVVFAIAGRHQSFNDKHPYRAGVYLPQKKTPCFEDKAWCGLL